MSPAPVRSRHTCGSDQLDSVLPYAGVPLAVRRAATGLMHQPAAPCSSYLASNRKVCRTPSDNTAAADTTVRRPASTSVNTAIRFRSRSLIVNSPILLVSFLMGGTMTFLMGAYKPCIHKLHYRNCRRSCRYSPSTAQNSETGIVLHPRCSLSALAILHFSGAGTVRNTE
jgi:hypothetical protein